MCNFCSFISDGHGNVFYFDAELRKKILNKELDYESADSHSTIADYFFKQGSLRIFTNKFLEGVEDKVNKYEYNPLTKEFTIDKLNTLDDSEQVKKFCENLDYKTVVPELIIKPIINPFKDRDCTEVTENDIKLLKEWVSVRDSIMDNVGDSVGDSIMDSVMDSVWNTVWNTVRDSVWNTVRDNVLDNVRDNVLDNVRDSVWNTVWNTVRDSVWAYHSSFFNIPKWKGIEHKEGVNPFQSGIDLWEKGIIPVFDGEGWMLLGKDGKIVFEITKEELMKR